MIPTISPKSPNGAIISDDKIDEILKDDMKFKIFTIQQLERIDARIRYMSSVLFFMFIILLLLILISNPHAEQFIQSAIQIIK